MTKVKVIARVRPFLPHEKEDDVVSVEEGALVVKDLRTQGLVTRYPDFAACYDHNYSHQALFEEQVEPLLGSVFKGVTVSAFCYGVSSSGKTTTMLGIIPRVVQSILATRAAHPQLDVQVRVSYLEIYKDDCYDLLVPRSGASKLTIREDSSGKITIPGLTCEPISTYSDFDAIFQQASKVRSTGATHLNRSSSRSHAMVTILVSSKLPTAHSVNLKTAAALRHKRLLGKINLIDLAGSENNKSANGKDAVRIAESAAINKSLSVLGQVINAINSSAVRIPYRDCKLTRILKDALGGRSVSLLVCNLAPGAKFVKDTISTIQFATRTKEVQNKPAINIRDDRDEDAAVQSILFDNTNIFNSPQKRSGDAANPATFTMEDFERKVEEEVQRRLREQLEIKDHLAQQALKDSNSTSTAHRVHGIGLDSSGWGQVFVTEKRPAMSPAIRTSNPSCESPQRHSEDCMPGRSSYSAAPYQNLKQSHREQGSQLSLVHAQAESTRHLCSREYGFHEGPPVPQAQRHSIKGKAPSRISEEGCDKGRERVNKSIKVAIQKALQNGEKDPKIRNKVISRAYVAAARKALDQDNRKHALELLQHAVSRNPQNAKLLEFTLNIQHQLQPVEQGPKLKRAYQNHSQAQDRPITGPRIQGKHMLLPNSDKPLTRPQETGRRHDDQQEASGEHVYKSRCKVSCVDDTDYDYLKPETGPSRSKAQNKGKRVAEVIDVDSHSSEDDWLPRKAKRKRKAQ